ncbi:MAG: hypothetical protein LBI61_02060 [Puniceicoccales bacterium]|jgi:hypothetical protein|nr:hypothetical protein [Puniceicoccales bacterium]
MKEFLLNLWVEHSDFLAKVLYAICGVVGFYALYLLCRKRRIILSSCADGCVSLANSALRKIVESVARDVGIRKKIGVKARYSRGGISIDITIRTGAWQNLAKISALLRERLLDVLVNGVGLVSIKKINVVIVGFLFGKCNCFHSADDAPLDRGCKKTDARDAACGYEAEDNFTCDSAEAGGGETH